MSDSERPQVLCALCITILNKAILLEEGDGDNQPFDTIHISHVTGTSSSPDLNFINRSVSTGCRLCSEVVRVHSTKMCNAFGGTTRESDAPDALDVVSKKFPRIAIDARFEPGDGRNRYPHFTLIYTHTIKEGEEGESTAGDESDPPEFPDSKIVKESLFSGFEAEEAVLDTDTFLHTMFVVMKSQEVPDYLFPPRASSDTHETTASESSWAQCTNWLDHCTSSHDCCNKPLFPVKILPKRLINIGDEVHPPVLCLSESLSSSTEYVTLSHCWGKSKVATLTSSTNPIFSRAIPVSDLSQTFRDAIAITRRLSTKYGIKYLWIDSLCILQDSKQEWLEEAPRMAEIYGNCWCNIAATAGGGLSTRPAGMFSQRDPNRIKPIQTFIPTSGGIEYTIFDDERWSDFVKKSPLNSRAWVCQERLLSPRILHFGVDEIFWECSLGRASETFPRGEPAVDMIRSEANERLVRAVNEDYNIASDPYAWYEDPLSSWLEVAQWFSECDLTYTSDKLFAIAGLAQYFQAKLDGVDYLAGLWRTSLERQLLWKVVGVELTKRTKEYRAPSWCWSSMDGPLLLGAGEENSDILLKVLEANVQLEGTNPFGNTISGLLKLKGRMFKGRLASDTHYYPGLRPSFDESIDEIAYHPDEYVISTPNDEIELFCMLISLKHVESGSEDDESLEDLEEKTNRRDVIAETEPEEDVRLILQGLVLTPLKGADGQYQRIGTFETMVPNEIKTILESLLPQLEKGDFEEFDGKDQYTISIL